jgi:hypothetical protein
VIGSSHFNIIVQKVSQAGLKNGIHSTTDTITSSKNRLLEESSGDVIKIDMDYDQKVFSAY